MYLKDLNGNTSIFEQLVIIQKARDLYVNLKFDINDDNKGYIQSIELSKDLPQILVTDFEAVFIADSRAPFINADISADAIIILLNE